MNKKYFERKQLLLSFTLLVLCLMGFLCASSARASDDQKDDKKKDSEPLARYTARALHLPSGEAGQLQIVINRWSTPEERQRLAQALIEGGSKKLADTLGEMPELGFIRFATTRGYEIRYAREVEGENGRQVLITADRKLAFVETARRLRTEDYNVGVIELRVDESGKGEGTMAPAVEVGFDAEQSTLTLESYSIEPIRLLHVEDQLRAEDK